MLPDRCVTLLICLTAVVVSMPRELLAQSHNEHRTWYFGRNAGLRFDASGVVALSNGAVNTREGCASISAPDGTFLFATDGITIFDRLGQPMPNGRNLPGHQSAVQAALILPWPGRDNQFAVFSVDANENNFENGVTMHRVDMTMRNGLGDVVERELLLSIELGESLTAVQHQNGEDFWIVSRMRSREVYTCWLLTNAGISAPVQSIITRQPTRLGAGHVRASPRGDVIATVLSNHIGLVRFDNFTGRIDTMVTLPFTASGYGLEFSADGTKLYATEFTTTTVTQWDVSQEPASIHASRVAIQVFGGAVRLGALQRAPDDRIYVAQEFADGPAPSLSVIESPNQPAAAAQLRANAIPLGPGRSQLGLPNIVYFSRSGVSAVLESPDTVCAGTTVIVNVRVNTPGFSTTWTVNENRVPGDSAVSFVAATPGISRVAVTVRTTDGRSVVRQKSIVVLPRPVVTARLPAVLCPGQDSVIIVTGLTNVRWSPGRAVDDSTSPAVVLRLGQTTDVRLQGRAGICEFDTTFRVEVPWIRTTADTTICLGASVLLTADSDGTVFEWRNDADSLLSTQRTITVSPRTTTRYTITVRRAQCVIRRSIRVFVSAPTPLFTERTKRICVGDSTLLVVPSGGSVQWRPTSGLSNPTSLTTAAKPLTTTTYTATVVTPTGCEVTDSVTVVVTQEGSFNLQRSVEVCQGSTVRLAAPNARSIVWQTTDGTFLGADTVLFYTGPSTTIIATGRSSSCPAADTIVVAVAPSPTLSVPPDTSVCKGALLTLRASGASRYEWLPATAFVTTSDTVATLRADTSVVITVVGAIGDCADTARFSITALDATSLQFAVTSDTATIAGEPATLEITLAGDSQTEILADVRMPSRSLRLASTTLNILAQRTLGDTTILSARFRVGRVDTLVLNGYLSNDADADVHIVAAGDSCTRIVGAAGKVHLVRCGSFPRAIVLTEGATVAVSANNGVPLLVGQLPSGWQWTAYDLLGRVLAVALPTLQSTTVATPLPDFTRLVVVSKNGMSYALHVPAVR